MLACASARPGAVVLLDDLAARRCAADFGIPVMGTAGLVLAARHKGAIPRADAVLEKLVSVGMYLAPRTLGKLLVEAGE